MNPRNARDGAPKVAVRLLFGQATAIGPGKADLLEAISQTGSISAAARAMAMSYRRAWLLVDTLNRSFRARLVETAAGGSRGGGARVTELGMEILRRYRLIERKATACVAPDIADLQRLMAQPTAADEQGS
ncbi:MAG: LysR family transcriptional regulator [Betaproteobacteria bacterium]|nr:LysR family transcriptional regulator [Betaproteobacteria bacterium]